MTPRQKVLLQFGRIRDLTPPQEAHIRSLVGQTTDRRDRGELIRLLAGEYDVSVRTIWRTLERSDRETVMARAGEYVALFELGDEGPVQVTEWVAAA